MLTTSYLALREDALNALRERRLFDALTAIEGQIAFVDKPIYKDRVYKLRRDYSMLLEYMKRGEEDMHREEYYFDFLRRAYTLSDIVHWEFQKEQGSTHRAEIWQRLQENAESLAEIYVPFVEGNNGEPATMSDIWSDPLGSYNQLFDTVWTSQQWTEEERCAAYDYIVSDKTPVIEGLACLAGVAMGLLSTFDEQKFLLLLSVYKEVDQIDVCARSIVFAMLAYAHYRDRMEIYPSLLEKIDEMTKIPYVAQLVTSAQIGFMATRETQELSRKSSQMIALPGTPNEQSLDLSSFAKLLSGVPLDEAFPDADDTVKQLAKSALRMQKLKVAGCDITYDTFSILFRKIPFFKETSNWFSPFSLDNPNLFNSSRQAQMIEDLIAHSSCDTGRYATMFMLMHESVEFQIAKHNEETKEIEEIDPEMLEKVAEEFTSILNTVNGTNSEPITLETISRNELETIVTSFVQDVFRYFTLYPKRNESENPFNANLEFWTDYRWSTFFQHPEELSALADRFSMLDRYEEALYFVEQHENISGSSAELYFAKGVCLMETENFQKAVDCFEKAYALQPEKMIASHLVHCHEELQEYDQMLYYLENTEYYPSDELKVMFKKGECYQKMERYDLAIAEYNKIHYLYPDNLPAFRSLAWSYLCDGQLEKASDCYNEIIGLDVIAEDFVRAGHCALLQKDLPTALAYYQECLRLRKQERAPRSFFGNDEDMLLAHGITQTTLLLILDILNMTI